jgi:hypothetical protein
MVEPVAYSLYQLTSRRQGEVNVQDSPESDADGLSTC